MCNLFTRTKNCRFVYMFRSWSLLPEWPLVIIPDVKFDVSYMHYISCCNHAAPGQQHPPCDKCCHGWTCIFPCCDLWWRPNLCMRSFSVRDLSSRSCCFLRRVFGRNVQETVRFWKETAGVLDFWVCSWKERTRASNVLKASSWSVGMLCMFLKGTY